MLCTRTIKSKINCPFNSPLPCFSSSSNDSFVTFSFKTNSLWPNIARALNLNIVLHWNLSTGYCLTGAPPFVGNGE